MVPSDGIRLTHPPHQPQVRTPLARGRAFWGVTNRKIIQIKVKSSEPDGYYHENVTVDIFSPCKRMAVHRAWDVPGWTVTAIASGLAFGRYMSRADARKAMQRASIVLPDAVLDESDVSRANKLSIEWAQTHPHDYVWAQKLGFERTKGV